MLQMKHGPLKRQAKGEDDETANPDTGGSNRVPGSSTFVCSDYRLCGSKRSSCAVQLKTTELFGPEGQGRHGRCGIDAEPGDLPGELRARERIRTGYADCGSNAGTRAGTGQCPARGREEDRPADRRRAGEGREERQYTRTDPRSAAIAGRSEAVGEGQS